MELLCQRVNTCKILKVIVTKFELWRFFPPLSFAFVATVWMSGVCTFDCGACAYLVVMLTHIELPFARDHTFVLVLIIPVVVLQALHCARYGFAGDWTLPHTCKADPLLLSCPRFSELVLTQVLELFLPLSSVVKYMHGVCGHLIGSNFHLSLTCWYPLLCNTC